MKEVWQSFSNRDIAVGIWLVIFLGFVLSRRGALASFKPVLHLFLHWKIWIPFFLLLTYVGVLILCAARLNLWDLSVLKDTVVWFCGTAVILMANSARAVDEPSWFRARLLEALSLTVVLEFVVATYVFPLSAELILVPVATTIAIVSVFAGYKEEFASVHRFLSTVMLIGGCTLLAYTVNEASMHLSDFRKAEYIQQLLITPVLTILLIPFLYVFAVICAVEGQFLRLNLWMENKPGQRKAAKKEVLKFCWNLTWLHRLRGRLYTDLQEAESRADVRQIMWEYCVGLRRGFGPEVDL